MNVIWFIIGLGVTFLVNIPFGFWRAHAKRTGNRLEWALAVHLVLWGQREGEAI